MTGDEAGRASASIAAGAGSGRLALVDGMRGYFLALMMSQHLLLQGDTWFRRLHHGELAFVEDAQGFVFLSGLVVGLVYAKILARQGEAALSAKARARVGELYRVMLLTVGVLVLAALAAPWLAEAWRPKLGALVDGSPPHLVAVAAMTLQPAFGDVLPQYMLYLLFAPLCVRAAWRGQGLAVICWSVAIWGLAQLGLHHAVAGWFASAATAVTGAEGLAHAYFNPLGWQLLFVVGLLIGVDEVRARAHGLPSLRERLLEPRPAIYWAAVTLVVVFAVLRVLHGIGGIGGQMADNFYRLFRRQDLSLVYVLNFAALAYLVATWVGRPQPGLAGRALRRLFGWRFLTFLGQHSLQVYAFHVVVVFAVIALDTAAGPFHPIVQGVIGISAIASLLLAAGWHAARVRWKARRAGQDAAG